MSTDFKLESEPQTPLALPSATLLDELGLRLNRRERELVKALNDVACSADDDVPLFWFKRVFVGWMAPQSDDRRARVRNVFTAAIEACDESSNVELCSGGDKT